MAFLNQLFLPAAAGRFCEAVAQRLLRSLVFRHGLDEFVVHKEAADIQDALVDRIRRLEHRGAALFRIYIIPAWSAALSSASCFSFFILMQAWLKLRSRE